MNRIVLFLDDVDDILVYLKMNCAKVQLGADTGVGDGAGDLLDATRKELHRLSIAAVDPQIEVRLGMIGAFVATLDRTKKSREIVDGVYKLAMQRRNYLAAMPLSATAIAGIMVIYWLLLATVLRHDLLAMGAIQVVSDPIFYSVMTFMIIGFLAFIAHRDGSVMIFRVRRRDRFRFGREVSVPVLAAIAASVVTLILTWIRVK